MEYPSATTVHRLDRPTSGVFLMALNKDSHRKLGIQFEKRNTAKTYKALVSGLVKNDTGIIDLALRTDWYNRPKQMADNCLGREAITHWRVLERRKTSTLMELNPVTGRSHQLRVHMAWLGHPIMGDEFYFNEHNKAPRLMLHAEALEIYHPRTNERQVFEDKIQF